jgi:ABC-type Fe3+/spermidine/putrescine transport system ATPase subunit
MSLVTLRGVSKRFGRHLAVDSVTLEVAGGEFFSLLGSSGCGKSTLLRLIAGFESCDTGEVLVDGRGHRPKPAHVDRVNMVFQNYALFPHLTASENIGFPLRMSGCARDEIKSRVAASLALVRLEGFGERLPRALSGGQQQRVALARALISRPRVVLLDEPLGALDLNLRKEMQSELARLQRETAGTFIHVTHDQEEALALSHRLAVMNAGRIEQVGTPEEIYERPASRFVATFIGESNFLDDGGAVRVLRPERIRLTAPGSGRARGVIESATYAGSDRRYEVRLSDNRRLIVRSRDHAAGEVGLDWSDAEASRIER